MALSPAHRGCKALFELEVPEEILRGNECAAIVGSHPALGTWDPDEAVLMEKVQDGGKTVWRAEVDLPAGVEISYKYVVFQASHSELVSSRQESVPKVDRAFLWENFIGNRGIDLMHEGAVRILSEVFNSWHRVKDEYHPPGVLIDDRGHDEVQDSDINPLFKGAIAIVSSVSPSSPAAEAGLLPGHAITRLGNVRAKDVTKDGIARIVQEVGNHEGKELILEVVTPDTGVHHKFILKPRRWAGDGLLGCLLTEHIERAGFPKGLVPDGAKVNPAEATTSAGGATKGFSPGGAVNRTLSAAHSAAQATSSAALSAMAPIRHAAQSALAPIGHALAFLPSAFRRRKADAPQPAVSMLDPPVLVGGAAAAQNRTGNARDAPADMTADKQADAATAVASDAGAVRAAGADAAQNRTSSNGSPALRKHVLVVGVPALVLSAGILACFPGLIPPAPPALVHLSSVVVATGKGLLSILARPFNRTSHAKVRGIKDLGSRMRGGGGLRGGGGEEEEEEEEKEERRVVQALGGGGFQDFASWDTWDSWEGRRGGGYM